MDVIVNFFESAIGVISSVVAVVGSIAGVWISIAKHRKESRNERNELLKQQEYVAQTLERIVVDIEELKTQNQIQQSEIESSKEFTKSHFRIGLYNLLTMAMERGYTYVSEATEITKMYAIYKKYGGNGEIELLYHKYDKLEIKEDKYEIK